MQNLSWWNWIEDYILSSDGDSAKLKITDAKLHVPIVTLSTKDNVNLAKQLSDGFKTSAYWNNYKAIPAKVLEKRKNRTRRWLCKRMLIRLCVFQRQLQSNCSWFK